MRIYMAAVYTNNYKPEQARWAKLNENERQAMLDIPYILESYHYVKGQRYINDMRRCNAQVFLDSGAFSMWTKGEQIPVHVYCDYVKANEDIVLKEDGVLMASVLDSIGNDLGTYRNQLEMEWRGVTPLPCFHFGEDERYLEYYMSKYPYITIGGMVGKSKEQLFVWLDRVWNKYMLDGAGRPKAKFHGFGITQMDVMERYDWWSVDSSSWIQAAAYGNIIHRKHKIMAISGRSKTVKDAGRHILTYTPDEQEYLLGDIRDSGFDPDRLKDIYESRAAYNVWTFNQHNKDWKSLVSKTVQMELL